MDRAMLRELRKTLRVIASDVSRCSGGVQALQGDSVLSVDTAETSYALLQKLRYAADTLVGRAQEFACTVEELATNADPLHVPSMDNGAENAHGRGSV